MEHLRTMRILHVLSQHEITGAEVYAVHLALQQRKTGHDVMLVTDTLTYTYDGEVIYAPISKRTYPQRARNIRLLIKLIRARGIQLVNAHSRAASWVCFVACKITGTPFVSTVHGLQHLHTSSKNFNIYGTSVIAVTERLREHLARDLRIPIECIAHIPNGFFVDHRPHDQPEKSRHDIPVLMFAGRLSGPKGDVLRFLLKSVLPDILSRRQISFRIVCGTLLPPDIMDSIDPIVQAHGQQSLRLEGYQSNLPAALRSADLVIGSGRVALEAILEEIPTIAFGESGYEGVVRSQTFGAHAMTNFGDTGAYRQTIASDVTATILEQLDKPVDESERRELRKRVADTYNIVAVERAVADVYRKAIAVAKRPLPIPVLMYHRVVEHPPTGSRHGIWVTAASFRRQMMSLHRRGCATVTFQDCDAYFRGEATLPARPVILTFDDGYEDNYRIAAPILEEFGMRAVIFMVAGKVGSTNTWDGDEPQVPLMSAQQLRAMADHGHEIGSHTMTHPHVMRISEEQARTEFIESRTYLSDVIGRPVTTVAYPYGGVNEAVKTIARECGYAWGIAATSGPARVGEDHMEVRRTQVFPWTGRFGFWKKTQPWYLRYKTSASRRPNPDQ